MFNNIHRRPQLSSLFPNQNHRLNFYFRSVWRRRKYFYLYFFLFDFQSNSNFEIQWLSIKWKVFEFQQFSCIIIHIFFSIEKCRQQRKFPFFAIANFEPTQLRWQNLFFLTIKNWVGWMIEQFHRLNVPIHSNPPHIHIVLYVESIFEYQFQWYAHRFFFVYICALTCHFIHSFNFVFIMK